MRWKLHLRSSNLVLLSLYEFRGSDSSPFSLPSRVFKRRRKHKGGEKPKGDISRDSHGTDCIFDYFSDSSSLGSGMSHRSNATPYTWKMTWSLAFLVILSLGKSSLIHIIRCLICSTDCDLIFFFPPSVLPIIFLGVTAIISLLRPTDYEQTSTSSPVYCQVLSCTCEEGVDIKVTFSCF